MPKQPSKKKQKEETQKQKLDRESTELEDDFDLDLFTPKLLMSLIDNASQEAEKDRPEVRVKQTRTTASLSSKYTRAEDMFAAGKGDAPGMKELVRRAREDDDEKSFMKLIEYHTLTYLADRHRASTLLHPWIDIDYEFYKQPWVQKKLAEGMLDQGRKGTLFREKFWKSATSNIETDHLKWAEQDQINKHVNSKIREGGKNDKLELKKYLIMRRDKWNADLREKRTSFEKIYEECVDSGIIGEHDYRDIGSFRRYLNNYGVRGKPRTTGEGK